MEEIINLGRIPLMEQNPNRSLIPHSQVLTVSVLDQRLVQLLDEKLTTVATIEDYQKVSDIILDIRKKSELQDVELKLKQLEVKKATTELFFLRLQRIITTTIGVGLFAASFFVFPTNGLLGGIFFGTGLGALGIAIVSLKSVLK